MVGNYQEKPQLGFMEAVKICFQKFANFKGRARRSEFWWWYLFCGIVNCVFYLPVHFLYAKKAALMAQVQSETFDVVLNGGDIEAYKAQMDAQDPTTMLILFAILAAIVGLILFIPTLAAMVRRLHDCGKSGNLCWLFLLCGIGGLIPLLMCIPDGQPQPNQYGESPKYVPNAVPQAQPMPLVV